VRAAATVLGLLALLAGCSRPGRLEVGGDRPVDVLLPPKGTAAGPAPLLLVLHGFGGDGDAVGHHLGLAAVARERGMVYAAPDGLRDRRGRRFWNATPACCDLDRTGVDDQGYLLRLIDEIAARVPIDPRRVHVAGFSNGGNMAFRLACKAGDRIASIASVAGATYADPADCGATRPVSVLHVHGDRDMVVPYRGGRLWTGFDLPGAREATDHFARVAGCGAPQRDPRVRDLDASVPGGESTGLVYQGCPPGLGVELWTIGEGGHIPDATPELASMVIEFLLAHPRR
jgi:polyhydroxybutyrate depolymerase